MTSASLPGPSLFDAVLILYFYTFSFWFFIFTCFEMAKRFSIEHIERKKNTSETKKTKNEMLTDDAEKKTNSRSSERELKAEKEKWK